MKKVIFGFMWGLTIAIIIESLGGQVFTTWQYWMGLFIPIMGVFMCEDSK